MSESKEVGMDIKVLVTGWSGFIGRAVTRRLDEKGIKWVPFEGNVLAMEDFRDYGSCSLLLHLAGINRVGDSFEGQQKLINVNLSGTINAVNFALSRKMRFIFAGTCCYGRTNMIPTPESEPVVSHDPYSYSKCSAEAHIQACHRFFGLEGTILRIFNAYGPEQPAGYLIPDIIQKIQDNRLRLFNLTSVRDYIFVEDIADLTAAVIQNPAKGLVTINAGSGTGYSVKDVLGIMFRLMGREVEVETDDREDFIKTSIADVGAAEKMYGWRSRTGIEKGLARVLDAHGLLEDSGLHIDLLRRVGANEVR
ncbi:MAG: SDR family oxidoreductase [Desulfobacter sp.]|nr:MAG: SDR family oxidoreductase [Desulfobacter sp.]